MPCKEHLGENTGCAACFDTILRKGQIELSKEFLATYRATVRREVAEAAAIARRHGGST